ncbi:unnamed protein product [Linum tenue]|uniref:Hexosyltransferase n=1 Tax=Linum tenue TaxID=586396 RepID=A0AAV0HBG2_9ROSI|nr:unnamed protein product [Linum tenue]
MKGNKKDSEKVIWDQLRSPSHANSISVPGSPAWILPKLMVWLLLFVTVTYVFYTLRLVSTSQPCNDDPLSRHRSSQPHHLSLVALSGNDSTDDGATTTGIALPRREIEERPKKQPTDLQHVVFGIAASAKLWEQRKEYIKIWYKADRMRGVVWLDQNRGGVDGRGLLLSFIFIKM